MELPHLGKHCHFHACQQLDFLPFICDACKETFCLSHKNRADHQCPAADPRERHSSPSQHQTECPSFVCCVPGCGRTEMAQITCHHCGGGFYCLSHRLQEDHSCPELPERKPDVSQTARHVQTILAQKPIRAKPALTNPKAIKMAAKVNLMRMKGKAQGDAAVPQGERVYFKVIPPLDSGKTSAPLFFSKMWPVGRVIDVVADRLAIPNPNNTTSPLKLRLFHGETGVLLPPDRPLGAVMEEEDKLLMSGGCLVLDLVEDHVTVLEGLERYGDR